MVAGHRPYCGRVPHRRSFSHCFEAVTMDSQVIHRFPRAQRDNYEELMMNNVRRFEGIGYIPSAF